MTHPPPRHPSAPFFSRFRLTVAEVVRSAEAGEAALDDVDRTLTDGVAYSMQLQTQLRRLEREQPSAATARRRAAVKRRLDELLDLVTRLRACRDGLAQSPRSVA